MGSVQHRSYLSTGDSLQQEQTQTVTWNLIAEQALQMQLDISMQYAEGLKQLV